MSRGSCGVFRPVSFCFPTIIYLIPSVITVGLYGVFRIGVVFVLLFSVYGLPFAFVTTKLHHARHLSGFGSRYKGDRFPRCISRGVPPLLKGWADCIQNFEFPADPCREVRGFGAPPPPIGRRV